MKLADRTRLISPPATSKMRSIANELKASGVPVVNFAAGELDFDTPPEVKHHARAALEAKRNVYTPTMGFAGLRQQIAQRVSEDTGSAYGADEVGVTAGAKQALYNAAMVLLGPGDEVIIPKPYWVTFPTQVVLAGARPVFIDTRPRAYRLLAQDVRAALTAQTRAIIINSPNNPTGTIYAREELRQIARLAVERDLWIVFDECYGALVRSGHAHASIVQIAPAVRSRTILVNSFSKSQAMTGWRLGYVAAPAPVIEAMENLQGHTTSNPNSIAQYAIAGALRSTGSEFIQGVNQALQQRLDAAMRIVARMPGISAAPAEGAFYLFLDVESKLGKRYAGEVVTDVDRLCELALRVANVALVTGSAFGDATSVRISYAVSTQDVVVGMSRLQDLFSQIL